jgi:hypothetical protein
MALLRGGFLYRLSDRRGEQGGEEVHQLGHFVSLSINRMTYMSGTSQEETEISPNKNQTPRRVAGALTVVTLL